MNLQDLNKEQKQLILLGIMGVVVFFALGNQLLMAPAKNAALKASELIDEKGMDVKSGKSLLSKDRLIKRELATSAELILKAIDNENTPPTSGKEFWAQRRIGEIGYELDMDLAVSEHNQLRYFTVPETDSNTVSFWVPYSVKISALLSYSQLIEFLERLQQKEPYVSLAILTVNPSLDHPQKHNVTIVAEWPVPRSEDDVVKIRALNTKDET
jgi:hypothetical protein